MQSTRPPKTRRPGAAAARRKPLPAIGPIRLPGHGTRWVRDEENFGVHHDVLDKLYGQPVPFWLYFTLVRIVDDDAYYLGGLSGLHEESDECWPPYRVAEALVHLRTLDLVEF